MSRKKRKHGHALIPAPRRMPTWDGIRNAMQAVGIARGLYSGVPMPVDGLNLVLEEKRPDQNLSRFQWTPRPNGVRVCSNEDVDESEQIRNRWTSDRTGQEVFIVWHGLPGQPNFRVELVTDGRFPRYVEALERLKMFTDTCLASTAYSLDAEMRAVAKLKELVGERQFKTYMFTGVLPETSKRSGVVYHFRRLRPTIAMKQPCDSKNLHFLAALCLHPIGYYAETWAGAMVPTDDVIAHLMLMRGDEHRFWKLSNQHSITARATGL